MSSSSQPVSPVAAPIRDSLIQMATENGYDERMRQLEETVARLEEEKKGMKQELWSLRDKFEEESWARKRAEEKLKSLGESVEDAKEELRSEVREGVKEEMKRGIKEVIKEELS